MKDHSAAKGQKRIFFPDHCIRRRVKSRKQRSDQDAPCIMCAAEFQYLMIFTNLKSACQFKFFARIRHFSVRQDERLLLCQVKDDAFRLQLRISSEQTQAVIERNGKPAAVFLCVKIEIHVGNDRKQQKNHSGEERIHKKFAHTLNMDEFTKSMKFQSILMISVSSSPFRKSGISYPPLSFSGCCASPEAILRSFLEVPSSGSASASSAGSSSRA